MKGTVLALVAVAASLVLGDTPSRERADTSSPAGDAGKFTFVRAEYDSVGVYGESHYFFEGRLWQRWETDYPEAEENFLIRIQELTTIQINPKPIADHGQDEDHSNQDQHAVWFHARQGPCQYPGQEPHGNATAVQWRQWQHVEDGKHEVQEN